MKTKVLFHSIKHNFWQEFGACWEEKELQKLCRDIAKRLEKKFQGEKFNYEIHH